MNVKISFDPRVNEQEGVTAGPDGFIYNKGLAAGAARFAHGRRGDEMIPDVVLRFICPCGCGAISAMPIKKDWDQRAWNFDGNKERPTCTPSIQMLTPCRWHGYLTNGEFVRC